jgi:hypothetical protein
MADRVSRTFELGIHRAQRLAATQPADELVATLNAFQPTALVGYASRQRSWSMVIGNERNRRPVAW